MLASKQILADTPPPDSVKRKPTKTIDFTVENIEAIKPPKDVERVEYKDTKEPGLYLRVTRTGVKTFTYVGRAKGASGVERKTLGKYPQVKPAQARSAARSLSGQQADGTSVAAPGRDKRNEMKLKDLWDLYYAYIDAANNKRPQETKRIWETYIEPRWGNKRLSEIQASAVEMWHLKLPAEIIKRREQEAAQKQAERQAKLQAIEERRKIRKHGPAPKVKAPAPPRRVITGETTANRALEVMRAIFNFGLDEKRQHFHGNNPAKGHESFKENERERFIYAAEFKPFFSALSEEPNEDVRDAILVALLTGQRRSNVLAMQWAHINLLRAEWQIPATEMKNGISHTSLLTPEIVELLTNRKATQLRQQLHEIENGIEVNQLTTHFVFPSKLSESGHLVDIRKPWDRIREKSNLKDVVLHDLRRTLGSWLMSNGGSLVTVMKALNHKSLDAVRIYSRLDRDALRDSVETATGKMFKAAGIKTKSNEEDFDTKPAPRKVIKASKKKV